MNSILGFIIGIGVLFLTIKILSLPIKIFVKLFLNGLVGYVILLIVNFFGASFGITIPTTLLNSVICGIFGIPGVIVLALYYKFM